MNEHESIRGMLALAAAGALETAELRQVQQHVQVCEGCRLELDTWSSYAQGLRGLPQPSVPVDLMERVQARVFYEHEASMGRRRNDLMLGALAVFGWAASVAFWMLAEVLAGGSLDLPGASLLNAMTWTLVSSVLVWLTAGTTAVMLGNRREATLRPVTEVMRGTDEPAS